MKKFACLLIVCSMLLGCSALAETQTVDLETMSLEELTALRDEVNAAIYTLSACQRTVMLPIWIFGIRAQSRFSRRRKDLI
jgi:uncharacterized protein YcfL